MSRYYRVVPPRWSLVSSILFNVVPLLYKIENKQLLLLKVYAIDNIGFCQYYKSISQIVRSG